MVDLSLLSNVVSLIDSTYSIYPLWLCPCRMQNQDTLSINIGIYGSVESLKDRIQHNGFMKTIRGGIEMKKNEENMKRYNRLRKMYHAEGAFPNIDEKVNFMFY